MAKVYVTQESGLDFTQAEKFGEIEFITSSDIVNIRVSGRNATLVEQIERKLLRYDYDHDFIVITGSPYVSALVFMILGLKSARRAAVHGVNALGVKTKYRVLRWSNRDKRYTPIEIEV